MKRGRFLIFALLFSFSACVCLPSCEVLLQGLTTDSSSNTNNNNNTNNNTNNTNNNNKTNTGGNSSSTSLGKK